MWLHDTLIYKRILLPQIHSEIPINNCLRLLGMLRAPTTCRIVSVVIYCYSFVFVARIKRTEPLFVRDDYSCDAVVNKKILLAAQLPRGYQSTSINLGLSDTINSATVKPLSLSR